MPSAPAQTAPPDAASAQALDAPAAGAPRQGPLPGPIDVDGFAGLAARAGAGRDDLIRRGHAPEGLRRLRRFGLAELCRHALGLPQARLRALLRANPDWPQGESDPPGAPPRFTLDETLALRARLAGAGHAAPLPRRPAGAPAKVLAFANFKGGVGKTSTAAAAAMAAALDGYRVLAIDLDSQGSLTSLLGGRVEDEWRTAFAAIARDFAREISEAKGAAALDETLAHAAGIDPAALVQPTHWPSIDLVGAELNLYWAEFQIPVWRMRHGSWPLWDALGRFLGDAGLLEAYDLVILDTPPALGYLTINALAAADIVVSPLSASFLDFDSTGRFLDMIATTFASIEDGEAAQAEALGLPPARFEWDAARLLLTRYQPAQQAEMAALIRAWFGPALMQAALEDTAMVGQAGEGVAALYDADPRDFNRDTYARGRETFDRVWAELHETIRAAWAADAAETDAAGADAGADMPGEDISHAKPGS